jgi:hypothetical protein
MILLRALSPASNRKVLAPESNAFKIDAERIQFLQGAAAAAA